MADLLDWTWSHISIPNIMSKCELFEGKNDIFLIFLCPLPGIVTSTWVGKNKYLLNYLGER